MGVSPHWPQRPIDARYYDNEPSKLAAERARIRYPVIFVPVFLILFFALVFGTSSLYEGKVELGIAIFIIAAVALALILGMWKKMNRSPRS